MFPQENWFYIKAGIIRFLFKTDSTLFKMTFDQTKKTCICLYKDKELDTNSQREEVKALTTNGDLVEVRQDASTGTQTPQEHALVHDIHLFHDG